MPSWPQMNDEYIERLRIVIKGYREIAALYVPHNHTQIVHNLEQLDHLAWGLGIGVGVEPGGHYFPPMIEEEKRQE